MVFAAIFGVAVVGTNDLRLVAVHCFGSTLGDGVLVLLLYMAGAAAQALF